MDAFTEYDVRWRKDLSVVLWRKGKEGNTHTNDNGDDGRKKDRWKVEIQ